MFWLVLALSLFIFQIATILVLEFRNPAKAVSWLMVLFIFPIIGFLMYYFLAKEYRQRKKIKRKERKLLEEMRRDLKRKVRDIEKNPDIAACDIFKEHRLLGLLSNIPGFPMTRCNELEVFSDVAGAYDAMYEAMEKARSYIHLEFYIVRDDNVGRKFKELLIRKAREGVKVRFIYDGVGSYKLSGRYISDLRENGVEVYEFLPPLIAFFDKRINYRNHRKIVVVDGLKGFLGGINIGDEYLGSDPVLGYWRDTHIQLEGDAVYYLQHTFAEDWMFVSGEKLLGSEFFPEHDCEGQQHVQVIASGPDAPWDAVQEVFFAAMAIAKERIYITTPYFIPDPSIAMALKTAAFSGVDVRIILPGVPDARVVHWASLSYIEELMQAGVRVYQYQRGFIHAKTLIIDEVLATVGTANMDMRSFFNNFEIMAVLYDRTAIERIHRDFQMDMKYSEEVILSKFERRSRYQRAKEVLARLLSPLF